MRVRQIPIEDRGKGYTRQQMLEAPQGALFIWCNERLHYPRDLAQHLGRDDLRIVSPDILGRGRYRLYGLRLSAIILDHAAAPNAEEQATLDEARARCVR
jgi:hypothetical protein